MTRTDFQNRSLMSENIEEYNFLQTEFFEHHHL